MTEREIEQRNAISPFKLPIRYDPGTQWLWDSNDRHVADMRGWGFLTGGAASNLPEDEAMVIQDEMGLFLAKSVSTHLAYRAEIERLQWLIKNSDPSQNSVFFLKQEANKGKQTLQDLEEDWEATQNQHQE